ncbi:hypothetical protein QGN29_04510 [Temperatibacter marinus]|uniref:Peptidase M61 catalytic domain-containing protein n=1 Tax=Temperatibacter marinus TaxID=1456591 RepID=A0AA52HBC9_9PROT|nr:hypothetical protein [Temperatibacter marinus]WND03635.1 hypothetical protein QGN29_04510 [Temperatibacter marinus]
MVSFLLLLEASSLRAEESPYTVIYSKNLPDWIKGAAKSHLEKSFHTYSQVFSIQQDTPINILIEYHPEGDLSSAYVQTKQGMRITLRGSIWENKKTEKLEQLLEKFIWHEGFHVWHIFYFPRINKGIDSFLMEGAAEYFHWKFAASDKNKTQDTVAWLQGCVLSTADRSLINVSKYIPAKANYLCGVFIQWMLDQWLDHYSKGNLSVEKLWQHLFTSSLSSDFRERQLLVRIFRYLESRAETAHLSEKLHQFIFEEGSMRWQKMDEYFAQTGINIRLKKLDEYQPDTLIETIIQNIIQRECTSIAPWIWSENRVSTLNSRSCGLLSKLNNVKTINGVIVPKDAPKAFLLIKQTCAENGYILLGRGKKLAALKFQCEEGIKHPPAEFIYG